MIRHSANAALVFVSLAASPWVKAQSNIALDRYDPAPAGSRLFAIANPEIESQLQPRYGYVFSYADAPLSLKAGDNSVGTVVSHQLVVHGLFSFDIAKRARLELDAPFVLSQGGESPRLGRQIHTSPHDKSVSDTRIGGHLALLGQDGARPAAALGLGVRLPTGSDTAFTGAGTTRWEIESLLGAQYPHWVWRAAVGFRRQSDTAYYRTGHNGWAASGGVAYRHGAFQLGPELFGFTATDTKVDAFSKTGTNLEWLFGVRFSRNPIVVGFAGGSGLALGPGTARYRVLFSLDYTPTIGSPKKRSVPIGRETELEDATAAASDTTKAGPIAKHSGISSFEPPATATSPVSEQGSIRGVPLGMGACAQGTGRQTQCAKDTDADGVDDAYDACPTEKGPPSDDPNVSGCPLTVTVQGEQLVLTQQVLFALGSDQILAESDAVLLQLVHAIQERPEIARVAVDGHTDNVGDDARNLALSRKRALAVVRWLVAHGVDERRLEARGFGPRQPIAPNDTDQGRALNRRVEFHVIKRTPSGKRGWKDGPANE